jgi:hypothetical protein
VKDYTPINYGNAFSDPRQGIYGIPGFFNIDTQSESVNSTKFKCYIFEAGESHIYDFTAEQLVSDISGTVLDQDCSSKTESEVIRL